MNFIFWPNFECYFIICFWLTTLVPSAMCASKNLKVQSYDSKSKNENEIYNLCQPNKKRKKKFNKSFSYVASPSKHKQIINESIIWVLLMISASSCHRSLCVLVKVYSFELFQLVWERIKVKYTEKEFAYLKV